MPWQLPCRYTYCPGCAEEKVTDPGQPFYPARAKLAVTHKLADIYEPLSRLTSDEQKALVIDLHCDINYLNELYDAVRVRYTNQENDCAYDGGRRAGGVRRTGG